MNIQQAKEQIKNAIKAYLKKDEFGRYKIPVERQRPIFLMGAPGIGKTAIMAQIAEEMNIGLVSYSMTHHTRQSALGLPFIVKKNYGGREYDVSEYTMSEIIASVYDTMELSNVSEGILFLDEINCVSETLAPAMLQFLQYKVFGRHRVPDGWIVVTAGNPPEYNKSVREFDIVTWDRLKRIDVEPDYEAWHDFAIKKGEHPAITSYLSIKKSDFYRIETTVDGKSFVTARGWDDLSDMIKLYEENETAVDEDLVGQYIQNKKIAKDFAIYYDLYNKYRADYRIESILDGCAEDAIVKRAQSAKFDERLSLCGMLINAATTRAKDIIVRENALSMYAGAVKEMRFELTRPSSLPKDVLDKTIDQLKAQMTSKKASSSLSEDSERVYLSVVSMLNETLNKALQFKDAQDMLSSLKKVFDAHSKALKKDAAAVKNSMNNIFKFANEAFGEGQEILIIVTELTVNTYSSSFIKKFGCEEYFTYNKSLMFYERGKEITEEIQKLDLEEL